MNTFLIIIFVAIAVIALASLFKFEPGNRYNYHDDEYMNDCSPEALNKRLEEVNKQMDKFSDTHKRTVDFIMEDRE